MAFHTPRDVEHGYADMDFTYRNTEPRFVISTPQRNVQHIPMYDIDTHAPVNYQEEEMNRRFDFEHGPQEPVSQNDFVSERRFQNVPESKCSPDHKNTHSNFHKPIITPQKYTGHTSWHDYRRHFEYCSTINGWSEFEQGMFLAASLSESAASILVGNTDDTFRGLCRALESAFGPAPAALCKSELRARRQRRTESYQSLSEDIRRLTMLAYPDLPESAWQAMACDAFIDALYLEEARKFVLQQLPSTLHGAVTAARQYDVIKARERDRKVEVPVQIKPISNENSLEQTVSEMAKQVKQLAITQFQMLQQLNQSNSQAYSYQHPVNTTFSQNSYTPVNANYQNTSQPQLSYKSNSNTTKLCWRCGQPGHFKRNCLNGERRDEPANSSERQ